MDNLHLLSVEAEAREYCDRHEIRDYDSFQRIAASLRHRAFLRAIEPLNAMKARWMNLCLIPRTMLIHGDGRVENLPIEFPPEMKKAFAELDELIILEAQRWGFDTSPVENRSESVKEVVGLGPHLFPDWEDSAGPSWVSAYASSAAKVPGQMSPCQPTRVTSGRAVYTRSAQRRSGDV